MDTAINTMNGSSTSQLLTTIFGDPELAWRIEETLAHANDIPDIDTLKKINGIGEKNARKVLACMELSRTYMLGTKRSTVTAPEDVAARICWMKYEIQENFVEISLDSKNCIIATHVISKGLINKVPVHPRESFKKAILDNAAAVIFAHNHPSGWSEPSPEDIAITRTLCAAGKILQIPVIDHIVIGKAGMTSICRQFPEIFERTSDNVD